jgi:golgi-specific brefeldin A-resistance guanine nucleotide exchange factor 1
VNSPLSAINVLALDGLVAVIQAMAGLVAVIQAMAQRTDNAPQHHEQSAPEISMPYAMFSYEQLICKCTMAFFF